MKGYTETNSLNMEEKIYAKKYTTGRPYRKIFWK